MRGQRQSTNIALLLAAADTQIMASPTPEVETSEPVDQIHFRFCRECSNLLYPKEDRANSRLMFTCRTCHVSEPATSPCVFQNRLNSQVGDTAGVTQDVGSDPTLPRSNKICPSCGEGEAVFFQSQQRSAETGMKLYYVCCTCGRVFT